MKISYDILAIDETGTPNLAEFYKKTRKEIKEYKDRFHFGLSGVIIPGAEYPDLNIRGRKIQEKCCGHEIYIPFHYVDILHNNKKWSFLGIKPDKKMSLIDLLNNLIKETNFKIISSFIDKKELALSFGIFPENKLDKVKKIKPNLCKPSFPNDINLYEVSLKFILTEFHNYLSKRRKRGIIIAEARGEKEDKQLLDTFYMYQKIGAGSLSGKEIRDYITDLLIIQKSQNHLGTQLSDLISFPLFDYFIPNHNVRSDHFIKKSSFEKKIISLNIFPYKNEENKISSLSLIKQKKG